MNIDELQIQVDEMARIERAINGENSDIAWPNWVYEARAAVRHMKRDAPPWLADLQRILGHPAGGTIHDALSAVRRLVEADKGRERIG